VISRRRAAEIETWNRADYPYPITALEFNWLEDGSWQRTYSEFEDGFHRAERALVDQVECLWVQVSEYRFAPKGQRPPDRADIR
jgi:hypothetical protein